MHKLENIYMKSPQKPAELSRGSKQTSHVGLATLSKCAIN